MKTSLYYTKRGTPAKWTGLPSTERRTEVKALPRPAINLNGKKVRTTVARLIRFRVWLEKQGYKVIDSKTEGIIYSVYKSGAYRSIKQVSDYHYALGPGLKGLFADFLSLESIKG